MSWEGWYSSIVSVQHPVWKTGKQWKASHTYSIITCRPTEIPQSEDRSFWCGGSGLYKQRICISVPMWPLSWSRRAGCTEFAGSWFCDGQISLRVSIPVFFVFPFYKVLCYTVALCDACILHLVIVDDAAPITLLHWLNMLSISVQCHRW